MKRYVFIQKRVSNTIRCCISKADNNYETGGVLIGYKLGLLYIIVEATSTNSVSNNSNVSFLLDGAEHTRKFNDITAGIKCSPSALGVWHSHICDGHNFSEQDKISNRILAKSLGGALSMLVSKPGHSVLFSISHISAVGNEEDCVINLKRSRNGGIIT